MFFTFAQVAGDPSSISNLASILQASGPYAMAAVLIVILWTLWGKLNQRDSESKEMATQFLTAVQEQSRVTAETSETLRAVRDGLQRVEDRVETCPNRE